LLTKGQSDFGDFTTCEEGLERVGFTIAFTDEYLFGYPDVASLVYQRKDGNDGLLGVWENIVAKEKVTTSDPCDILHPNLKIVSTLSIEVSGSYTFIREYFLPNTEGTDWKTEPEVSVSDGDFSYTEELVSAEFIGEDIPYILLNEDILVFGTSTSLYDLAFIKKEVDE
jgi:hypothetical protein